MCNSEYSYFKGWADGKGFKDLKLAMTIAKEAHAGQFRKVKAGSGEPVPYLTHPVRVTSHLMSLGIEDEALLCASMLHDVWEDTKINLDELKKRGMSEKCLNTIRLVSYFGGKDNVKGMEKHYLEMLEDINAVIVKLGDRCHNISTMGEGFTDDKVLSYIAETRTYILPLAKLAKDKYPNHSNLIVSMRNQIEAVCNIAERLIMEGRK